MAEDIREVLGRYVPASVLDEAVDAVKETEIAPEWFRSEAAKLGADAKEAQQLRSELESIRSEPQRVEAYKRVGLLPQDATDASALKPYQKDWLDRNIPLDDLGDLEKVASKVQEGGFDVSLSEQQQPRDKSGAEQITDFMTSTGSGTPTTERYEEAVEAARSPEELDAVYKRFGKQPQEQG